MSSETLFRPSGAAEGFSLPFTEVTVAALFFLFAMAAMLLTRLDGGISLIWPANALAAAFLIRSERVRWPIAAVLIFAACLAANVFIAQRSWSASLLFTALNGAEMAATVWLFRFVMRFDYPNLTINESAIMAAVFGLAIPGLSSVGGGIMLNALYEMPLMQGCSQWWSSHMLGACLVGPPIILFSPKNLRRLVNQRFLAQNLAMLMVTLLSCWLAIRYVRFPFVAIGVLLLIAAFRVGGFGAAVLGLCSGFTVAALWSLGLRPEGLERLPVVSTLVGLPVLALLATTMPPIAVGLGTDARRATVRKLNLSEQRFRESLEHSPIGMLIADVNGIWDYTNIALQRMLGYSAEEFRVMPPGGPSDPGEWAVRSTHWQQLSAGKLNYYDIERRFRHKQGHWVWTHVAVSSVRNDEGEPQYFIAQIESLEARKLAEEKLAEERARLRITLETIGDAVITTDAQRRITFINAAAEMMLGIKMNELEGRLFDEVIHLVDPDTSKTAANLLGQSAIHSKVFRRPNPCILHRPDGSFTFVSDVVSPVLNSTGSVTGMVTVLRDASSEVSRVRDLRHRASHDLMTGLANRAEFQRQLTEVLGRCLHLDQPAALLAIDLDRFKAVNDSGGHAAGDAVLRQVAAVLKSVVRHSDVIARLGGDEFAVILPNCPDKRSVALAEQLLQALNPLTVEWEGNRYSTGASIGLATKQDGLSSESAWLEAADHACYQAKHRGRGSLCVAQTLDSPRKDAHGA